MIVSNSTANTVLVDVKAGVPSYLFPPDAMDSPSRTRPIEIVSASDRDRDGVLDVVWKQEDDGTENWFFTPVDPTHASLAGTTRSFLDTYGPLVFDGGADRFVVTRPDGMRWSYLIHESTLHVRLDMPNPSAFSVLEDDNGGPLWPESGECIFGDVEDATHVVPMIVAKRKGRANVLLAGASKPIELRLVEGSARIRVYATRDLLVGIAVIGDLSGGCADAICYVKASIWTQSSSATDDAWGGFCQR